MRRCVDCGNEKPLTSFGKCPDPRYRRRLCYVCDAVRWPKEAWAAARALERYWQEKSAA